ncbi:putative HTH-type transcriptional regulator YdfH [Thalassovita autumnalis]|uniref:HTH-type transcriptional regulator YdfH n=1 Tax=Thalassovita autumnalis TaxID=2072972 RepID=A0A0P1FPI7_9RHOB|nr:GntR family transcriptional regulator [Thalassovita autumnalis]CUH70124.1 putative HTH-type transcriptional regulator YdfH [Thalassovita autumnalis]CUH73241.1 putative HTH-type transcriptional regulator YdfH [Thalassovita autumnalis]
MKLKSVDISRTASAATIVFEALRKAIIEGELQDGEPLRQDEIARMFNTSRIPVREAISRLEEQGLVKSQRYKGAVVAGLSLEEASEVFDFRALVECEVIRRAVPQMSPTLLAEARAYCEDFAASPNPMDWGDLNRKFHGALYSACALPYHISVVDNAMDRIDRYLRAQLVLSDGMERANIEHLAILEACEKGDAERAAALTLAHIEGAKASLAEHMKSR